MAEQLTSEERHAAWTASLKDGKCPTCGFTPGPTDIGCRACFEVRTKAEMRRHAEEQRIRNYRKRTDEYLRTLPAFPFASLNNPAWVEQVEPRLLSLTSAWDGTSSLMIHGPTGLGKTTSIVQRIRAKVEAARAAVEAGEPEDHFSFLFTTEADVLDAHRMYKLGTAEPRLHQRMRDCSLLILDEMGYQHEAGIPIVAKFIDARYREALPTVITSGLSYQQFTKRYSAAFVRRILQSGANGEYLDLCPAAKKEVLPR